MRRAANSTVVAIGFAQSLPILERKHGHHPLEKQQRGRAFGQKRAQIIHVLDRMNLLGPEKEQPEA